MIFGSVSAASEVVPAIGFGIATAAYIGLGSVGYTLQTGITGVINFAYGAILISAAFVAYAVNRVGGDLWQILVVGGATGAIVSYLVNKLVFRRFVRRGVSRFGMLIVTLWAGLILQNILLAIFGGNYLHITTPAGHLFRVLGTKLDTLQLTGITIAVVCVVGLAILLKFTRLGFAMRALATNPDLARASGVKVARVLDYTWLITGVICGLAGVLYSIAVGAFHQTSGNAVLIIMFTAAILGGVGRPLGAAIAALALSIAMQLVTLVIPADLNEIVAFVALILVLLLRPSGLFGVAREADVEVAVA